MNFSEVEGVMPNVPTYPEETQGSLGLNDDESLQTGGFLNNTSSAENDMEVDQSERAVVPFDSRSKNHRKSTLRFASRPIKQITCPVSGCASNVLQRTLGRHMRTVHKQGLAFSCEECGRQFLRKDTLDRHLEERHSGRDEKIECVACGSHVSKRALKEHFGSRTCQRIKLCNHATRSDVTTMPCEFSRMFDAIMQQSQEDFGLLRGLGMEAVCNPLVISFNFLFVAVAAGCRGRSARDTQKKIVTPTIMSEALQLRGLSLRTILRSSKDNGPGEEMQGAVRIFQFADLYIHDINPGLWSMQLTSTINVPCECKILLSAFDSCKPLNWNIPDGAGFEFECEESFIRVTVFRRRLEM